jgi:rhamnosyltransferase
MSSPYASLLLPTLNASRDLDRLLPALAVQAWPGEVELLAIDSSSDDDTASRLQGAGFRVESIPRPQFRHGATRNALVARAQASRVVLLTQDAVPSGPEALPRLVAHLDDPEVAGVSARLVPHPDTDPLSARTVLASPEASGLPEKRRLDAGQRLSGLPAWEAISLARFHNVASAYRRATLLELPFPERVFGEDVAWAARALEAGWALAHAHDAEVRHAHVYSLLGALERYRLDAAFLRLEFGIRVRSGPFEVLKGLLHELREDLRFRMRHGHSFAPLLLRAPLLRGAQVTGQLMGSLGWNLPVGTAATRRFS